MAGIDARMYSRAKSEMPSEPPVSGINSTGDVPFDRSVDVSTVRAGQATEQGLALQQGASMEAPGMMVSLGAAFKSSIPGNIWETWQRPMFEKDGPDAPQAYDYLKQIPFELNKEEYEALYEAKTSGERAWLVDQFTTTRATEGIANEYPLMNLATQVALDPTLYISGFGAAKAGLAIQRAASIKALAAARGVGPLEAVTAANIATKAGNAVLGQARVAAGVTAGVIEGGAALIADEARPMSDGELAMHILGGLAGGAMIPRAGRLVPHDPDLRTADMIESITPPKPHMRMTAPAVRTTDDFGNEVIARPAVWEEIPRPLREGASATPDEVAVSVGNIADAEAVSWGQRFGRAIEWNVHRATRSLSRNGDEVADLLVDNQAKYGIHSAESIKAGIKKDLGVLQWSYESAFRAALAERGHGSIKQLASFRKTREASTALEYEVAEELTRRETLINAGRQVDYTGVNPAVKMLADKYGAVMSKGLDEYQIARVTGAETVQHNPGYFHRSYSPARIGGVTDKLIAGGMSKVAAHAQVVKLFKASLLSKNPQMTDEVANDVAGAIVDRTIRKGRFEDVPSNNMFGSGTAAEVEAMLKHSGLPKERLDRVIKVLMGRVDEQGKVAYLKHRVDLDYNTSMTVNGKQVRMLDMLETNVNTLMDRYIDSVSARAALAHKGLRTPGDITKLRERYLDGATDKAAASKMFDNVLAHLEGRPTGEDMNKTLRVAGAYSRMITLGSSAIWQSSEYSTMAAQYGYLKTFKYAMAEMPLFKKLMETAATDKVLSRDLKDIITNQAEQSIRLRPYITKFEDNFEIPKDSQILHVAQQGAQMVPYFNAMKLIHGHQARIHANLLVDTVRQAARGDAKAVAHLKGYGIESHIMDKLGAAVSKHGMDVDKWDDAVWVAVRPAFAKMTDESVLHARMGDMPAFALFSTTGKFIFQYRSFVLTAHNKVLSGTASRNGLSAVALMAMYQMPLAMMATQANEVAAGREPLETEDLIKKSIGQAGSLGLLTEVANLALGNKREVGAPGLIPFDRGIKAGQSWMSAAFGEGSAAQATKDSSNLIPLLAVIPGWKMLNSLYVEDKGK